MTFSLKFTSLQSIIILLVVVVIVSTVFLAYLQAGGEARDQQRLLDMTAIESALNLYFDDYGSYPSTNNALPKGLDIYLEFWPQPAAANNCKQNSYSYTQKAGGTDYAVSFCLEDPATGLSSGMHTLSSKGIF
jgi:hypothetical protein